MFTYVRFNLLIPQVNIRATIPFSNYSWKITTDLIITIFFKSYPLTFFILNLTEIIINCCKLKIVFLLGFVCINIFEGQENDINPWLFFSRILNFNYE